MKKLIVLALVAAATINSVAAEELVLYDVPVVVPDQVGEAYLDREPELVIYDDQVADTAPLVVLDQVGEAYLDSDPSAVLVGDLPTSIGTIPMEEALSLVSAENAVDLSLWATDTEEPLLGDALVASADTGDYDPMTNGLNNSRQWRLMEGYDISIIISYSGGYGQRDLTFVGAPGFGYGWAGASGRTLELDRGYYGGSKWAISEARRNYNYLWGTDISRRGMDWLPILGAEVYLDLAWVTARARDLALEMCEVLDDLYTLDGEVGKFKKDGLLAQTLVDEFARLDGELGRALTLRSQVIYFAEKVLASGGVNNPISQGRDYNAVAWDFDSLFGGTVSRETLDNFIGQHFGWDCIPRAYEDMPWYYPTPAPVVVPTTTPVPVAPTEPTVEPGTPAPAHTDPEPTPSADDTADFSSGDLVLEEEFTDGELILIEEGIIVLDEAPWDEELSLDEEIIFLD